MKTPATTIRWDSAEKLKKIRAIAKAGNVRSLNRLVNSWADTVIISAAAEDSFRASARNGDPKRLLALLDKLDEADRAAGIAGTKP